MPASHVRNLPGAYLDAAQLRDSRQSPLFRSSVGGIGILTGHAMHHIDAYRPIQRCADGMSRNVRVNCHTLRATGSTVYLEAGGILENAQIMAAHESSKTRSATIARVMRSRSMRSSG